MRRKALGRSPSSMPRLRSAPDPHSPELAITEPSRSSGDCGWVASGLRHRSGAQAPWTEDRQDRTSGGLTARRERFSALRTQQCFSLALASSCFSLHTFTLPLHCRSAFTLHSFTLPPSLPFGLHLHAFIAVRPSLSPVTRHLPFMSPTPIDHRRRRSCAWSLSHLCRRPRSGSHEHS